MFVQHGMGMTFTLLKISSSNFISFLKSTLFLFVLFIHSLSLFKIFFLNVSEKIKCVYIILLIAFYLFGLLCFNPIILSDVSIVQMCFHYQHLAFHTQFGRRESYARRQ